MFKDTRTEEERNANYCKFKPSEKLFEAVYRSKKKFQLVRTGKGEKLCPIGKSIVKRFSMMYDIDEYKTFSIKLPDYVSLRGEHVIDKAARLGYYYEGMSITDVSSFYEHEIFHEVSTSLNKPYLQYEVFKIMYENHCHNIWIYILRKAGWECLEKMGKSFDESFIDPEEIYFDKIHVKHILEAMNEGKNSDIITLFDKNGKLLKMKDSNQRCVHLNLERCKEKGITKIL
jgi:hypothetical protein